MNWKIIIKLIIILFLIIFMFFKIKNIIMKFKLHEYKKYIRKRNTPYINQPLNSIDNDQIGVSVYVEKIRQAITSGAEIIAIASDFGTGKSSLISLLEKEYGIIARLRYKFSTINLWGFVNQEDDATEIHRNFIYQLVSHLNPKRGSHLSKRMSKNFGVLRLGLGSSLMTCLSFAALLLLLLAEVIRRYPEIVIQYLQNFIPEITEYHVLNVAAFCYFFFVIILFYIITRTDIVFSSPKSEGNREIDENIVMDYYKMQVLNKGFLKHYVVVIEDLDRISNPQVIFNFLIELHKYYIPEYDNRFGKWLKNKVTFIVCIKPAAQLQKELNDWISKPGNEEKAKINESQMQEIYSKIFDLIIELRRINIDNYDAILRGLLEEKKDYLWEKNLINDYGDDVFSIEGIQWIIRGEELSIREIKQRLNDAFILYEVLVDKFGSKNIEFYKCIIVSYLTNAFPADMLKIKDDTFDDCINSYIKDVREYDWILKGCSEGFIETVSKLIEGKQIQADYRVYFYNYPRKSYLYNMFELTVINTLLYDAVPDDDFEFALKQVDDEHILYAIRKIHDLKIVLPKVALKYEKILRVVLNSYPKMITEYISDGLDYSEDEITRTTAEIKDIIHILLKNKEISNQTCNDIISAWNTEIPKKSLLEIRNMLCKEYREDILIFKQLFKIDNPLITVNEMKSIGNNNVVLQSLINYGNASFDDTYFEKVCELLKNETLKNTEVQAFFIKAYDIVTKKVVVEKLLLALEHEEILSDEIDSLLRNAVSGGFCSEEEYIKLLEQKKIPDASIHKVYEIGWSKGLSEKLCNALYQKEYYVDYIVNAAVEHIEIIDFSDKNVMEAIKEYAEDIFDRNEKAFKNIRLEILKEKLEAKFEYLFLEPFLGINEEELYSIDDVVREIALMEKNTPELTMEVLIKHFNSKYHGPLKTVQIIDFIHNLYSTSQDFSVAFYKLDMDNVRFRSISKANRARILTYIKKLGMLSTVNQIINFMKFTKRLLPELEKEISSSIVANKDYEDEYVDLINTLEEVTPQTVKNIKTFKYLHIYRDRVNESLLKEKLHREYLYSVTMKNKVFIIPKTQELYVVAENIFKVNKWDSMISVMCKNEEFMNAMIEKEIYKTEPLTRDRFAASTQNAKMIKNLFESCTSEEIISYLCKIKGFKDYEAAKEFVDLIEQNSKVLVNADVYAHTHHRLIDQYLKGRYTKTRNAILKK